MPAYTVIPLTPLDNFTPVPPVGMPNFAHEAWLFVNKWTGEWIPAINMLSQGIESNAQTVVNIANDLVSLTAQFEAAAAAAISGSNAPVWASGGNYVAPTTLAAGSVVLDPADFSKTYRCIANVNGSATQPKDDPAHWKLMTGLQPPPPPVIREAFVALGAGNNVDLAAGGVFAKTITANTTLTVSNPAPAGTVSSGILELTNAGAFVLTLWAGSQWSNGVVPFLSAAGTDVIGFYTRDGGATYVFTLISQKKS